MDGIAYVKVKADEGNVMLTANGSEEDIGGTAETSIYIAWTYNNGIQGAGWGPWLIGSSMQQVEPVQGSVAATNQAIVEMISGVAYRDFLFSAIGGCEIFK